MKATIVAMVLIEHEGKYLLVQQARSRRQAGKWGPPGGKPEHDQGEDIFDGAKREVLEEVGQPVELTGFVGIARSAHRTEPNLFICFAGRFLNENALDNLHAKEGEISGLRWLTPAEVEAGVLPLRSEPFSTLIRRHHNGQIYPLDLVLYEPIDPE